MMLIDEDTGMKTETPWHVWVVGVLAILWNAGGAWNYVATKTGILQMPDEIGAFYDAMPFWATGAWAVAVWASLIGSVLILFRSRYAAPVFLTSLIAMAISFFHNIVLSNMLALMPAAGYLIFTGFIVLIAVGLYIYARWLARWSERQAKMYLD